MRCAVLRCERRPTQLRRLNVELSPAGCELWAGPEQAHSSRSANFAGELAPRPLRQAGLPRGRASSETTAGKRLACALGRCLGLDLRSAVRRSELAPAGGGSFGWRPAPRGGRRETTFGGATSGQLARRERHFVSFWREHFFVPKTSQPLAVRPQRAALLPLPGPVQFGLSRRGRRLGHDSTRG